MRKQVEKQDKKRRGEETRGVQKGGTDRRGNKELGRRGEKSG